MMFIMAGMVQRDVPLLYQLIPFSVLAALSWGIAFCAWGLAGEEDLVLGSGSLLWTRRIFRWGIDREIPTSTITSIRPITSRLGGSNTVEIIAQGKHHYIGAKLLTDETNELAEFLSVKAHSNHQ